MSPFYRFVGMLCILAAMVTGVTGARADELSIVPVLLDMPPSASAATLTLQNNSQTEARVQVRVFLWSQAEGQDVLTSTSEVVASPPSLSMEPGSDYIVRVVRTAKSAVRGVESYRVLVDQIPSSGGEPNSVKLLVRQSIPVFFRGEGATSANVHWTLTQQGGQAFLTATNQGDGHLRVSNLTILAGEQSYSFGAGLNGYVLGQSMVRWPVPQAIAISSSGIQVTAATQEGQMNGAVDRQ